jgi:hypothetical protein
MIAVAESVTIPFDRRLRVLQADFTPGLVELTCEDGDGTVLVFEVAIGDLAHLAEELRPVVEAAERFLGE